MHTIRTYVAGVAVLLIALGAWYFISRSGMRSEVRAFEWQLTSLEPIAEMPDMPRTGVTLKYGGALYSAGEFDGSCFVVEDSEWELLEDERSGVICWWAGGGREIGVFEEGGALAAKVGIVEEGTAEDPGFRGEFTELFRVEPPLR